MTIIKEEKNYYRWDCSVLRFLMMRKLHLK